MMKKAVLSEKEQTTLVDLICFLFEHEDTLKDIYNKITMSDTVYYVSKKQESKPLRID